MPDSTESRLGQLERDASALAQQVHDLASDVEKLAPVQMSVARVEIKVSQLKEDLVGLRLVIEQDRRAAQERGELMAREMRKMRDEQSSQARDNRKQIWTAVVAIIVALITCAGTIVAAGVIG